MDAKKLCDEHFRKNSLTRDEKIMFLEEAIAPYCLTEKMIILMLVAP